MLHHLTRCASIIPLLLLLLLSLVSTGVSAHGEADEEASALEEFLASSKTRTATAFLHSVGAILLTTGLVVLLVMLRQPSLELEPNTLVANRLVLAGIAMNLTGGLMRLFEPGHPSLLEFMENRWVTMLATKHLLLLVTYAASIVATRSTVDRERRRLAVLVAIGGVIVVSILGAAADVLTPGED
ncbi:MAG: hypothetical protein BEU05_00520 [Marine Group III euryarchaeote CG-Bathy2]|uniref:Copper resistance protein D domain-containing protein n=2 Tax=Methanobacteriati TaxID=3366610 RepID=A0A075H486_9EURY|nr:hypothetical protein [uncultured marine group II/III euryarchaeote KM3_35_H09]OIR13041.1 MAG: hypothetical protein BEU05_00520 [Marine Group III euryarchaeote CG-Bathy2]